MNNHAHLLLKVQSEDLESIFKRIGAAYVYYFNVKYQRVGHLFQDRFKSEPVENDAYFLTVLRYIHQNPVKAGLCKKLADYPYSSYSEYLHQSDYVNREFALGIMELDEFKRFHSQPNSDNCLEVSEARRKAVTDTQAQAIIEKISRCKSVTEFQNLPEEKRVRYIEKIYSSGVSIRQLNRLTGTSKGIIERYLKPKT